MIAMKSQLRGQNLPADFRGSHFDNKPRRYKDFWQAVFALKEDEMDALDRRGHPALTLLVNVLRVADYFVKRLS